MDWPSAAFDWNRARALLVTAEEGSFSAAARALGQTQSTLGRQVSALERELGVTLFERVGHQLILTTTGLELVEQVRTMNEAALQLSLIAAGQSQDVSGIVRLAASEAVAAHLLPKIVQSLCNAYPEIEFEIVVSNQQSDLRRREADIAIRHARPSGDELIARLIKGRSVAHLYGAPCYLARLGHPQTPEELVARAHVIGFDEGDQLRKGLEAVGLPFSNAQFPLRTPNHLVQWELAKAGGGLCVMMEEVGDQEPAVVRALPDHPSVIGFSTWLVSHRELKTSRRIRVIYDRLADLLQQRLGAPPRGYPGESAD